MQLSNKVTPSLQELTEVSNYKNSEVVKHYGNMSLQVAINSPSKSIGRLTNTKDAKGKATVEGETTVKKCISNMFIGTSMYFDKVLPARQAEVIAEELLAKYEYRQLKLEDILAICIEIKEGETFKLTPASILRYVKQYYKRREALAIQTSIQQSQDLKSGFDSNYDERVLKTARTIERSNQEISRTRVETNKFYK